MYKHFITGAAGLLAGLVIGFFGANNLNRSGAQAPQASGPNPPFMNQQTQNASVKDSTGAMMSDVSATLELAKKEPENFDAQIKAGEMFAQIQNADRAAGYFDAAAALKPTEPDKIVKLGNAYFDIGQYEKAGALYQQALEKNPQDVNVRTDLGITFVERPNPDYDRAIKEFQTSLATNPKHEPTLYNLTFAYFKKGDRANADKYLAQFEQTVPNSQWLGKLKQAMGK